MYLNLVQKEKFKKEQKQGVIYFEIKLQSVLLELLHRVLQANQKCLQKQMKVYQKYRRKTIYHQKNDGKLKRTQIDINISIKN